MRYIGKVSILFVACASFLGMSAAGQDSQSLGDAARQSRQHKQSKESKTPKVITNEELPQHATPSATARPSDAQPREVNYTQSTGGAKVSAEQWKTQISAQKNLVSSLQKDIDKLNDSIHFAPANCVANCAQWNERQREKEQQVDQMKAQLDDQTKRLVDMQEEARQQGYGSSVYEP